MTGTQIKTLAESYIDDILDDIKTLNWINECLIVGFGVDGRVINNVNIIVASTTEYYSLPADFISVYEIIELDNAGSEGETYDGIWRIRNNKIKISDAGSYKIYYYAIPTTLSTLSESPNINTMFHRLIALYVASRYKRVDDDENVDSIRLMNEFEVQKKKILAQIDSQSNNPFDTMRVI